MKGGDIGKKLGKSDTPRCPQNSFTAMGLAHTVSDFEQVSQGSLRSLSLKCPMYSESWVCLYWEISVSYNTCSITQCDRMPSHVSIVLGNRLIKRMFPQCRQALYMQRILQTQITIVQLIVTSTWFKGKRACRHLKMSR